jgi:hypothetical protein
VSALRLIMEGYLGYAVIAWSQGWEAFPGPSTADIMWNGIRMTEAELRETFGDLPQLPDPTKHPWHDNNRLRNRTAGDRRNKVSPQRAPAPPTVARR